MGRKGRGCVLWRGRLHTPLHAVMDFLLLFSVLLFGLRPTLASRPQGIKPTYKSLARSSSLWAPLKNGLLRSQRSTTHKITECVFATSEEGFYYYEADEGSEEVCGVYLFADPDQLIQVRFEDLDVSCEGGGLVTFFDGWELNGKFFPGVDQHEKLFEQRYTEFCGSEKAVEIFETTQNAGMLHHRIPAKGGGFGFHVKFLKNSAPCNILVESKEGFYTLRNYGKASNCTLVAVFPAKIRLLAVAVGVVAASEETGTILQDEEKVSDGVQIGGSEDLDSSRFTSFENLRGLDSFPGQNTLVIRCEVSVVRLMSSGQYDNSVTFGIGQPEDEELFHSSYTC